MAAIERIILIDDNDADNAYHEIIIRRAGFAGELVVLENGVEALRYFETADFTKPTYIFLDINMPMLDGFEVAERARPLLRDMRTVVLVMLTSSSSPDDRRRAAELDIIRGFITKPLTDKAVKALMSEPV